MPLREGWTSPCLGGEGMAVCLARRLVVLSCWVDYRLHCYDLDSGRVVAKLGRGKGKGDGQFDWFYGGLCVTPRGSLLVADFCNNRLPEVDMDSGDAAFVRVLGGGKLPSPQTVDCTPEVVAVASDVHFVFLLSMADGCVTARLGGYGLSGTCLKCPRGVRLLADGSGVVVADRGNRRVVVLDLDGRLRHTVADLTRPLDVVECGGESLLVADAISGSLVDVRSWRCGGPRVCVCLGCVCCTRACVPVDPSVVRLGVSYLDLCFC